MCILGTASASLAECDVGAVGEGPGWQGVCVARMLCQSGL